MKDYYLRIKSGSNQACEIKLIECDNDAEASEVANDVAVAWGRGNGSTEVSYAVETYSGRTVDGAIVDTALRGGLPATFSAATALTEIAQAFGCEPDDHYDLVEAAKLLVKERDEAVAKLRDQSQLGG